MAELEMSSHLYCQRQIFPGGERGVHYFNYQVLRTLGKEVGKVN